MIEKPQSVLWTVSALKRLGGIGNIAPNCITGYQDGAPVNFNLYDQLGFHHPKKRAYYQGLYSLDKADEVLVSIYNGIKSKGVIDDAIVVYVIGSGDDSKLIVLDGATRLSCIAFIRNEDPSSFETIPVILFQGTNAEAKAEMVRRNREGNSRPLDSDEFAEAIIRFQRWGWTDKEIRGRLGIPESSKQILSKYVNLYENGIPELKEILHAEMISLNAAFFIARLSPDKQMIQVNKAKSGKKITVKDAEGADSKRTVKKVSQRFKSIDTARQEIESYCSKNGILSDKMLDAIQAFAEATHDLDKAINQFSQN